MICFLLTFFKRGVGITRKGRVVQEQILVCIQRENSPLSTLQLSSKLGFAWHTIQHYCIELLFRKKIDRLEIAGRHIWVQSSSQSKNVQLPDILENNFAALLENHIEKRLEKEFEKEFEKEINNELQTLLKNLSDTEIRKKARENRITVRSAGGGENK
ncbi:hypothetical protein HZA99_02780 [Candidatus Woesearchaeota archaeon]|nr:hypothetical protein [Candidatus Woesearchaeota archaeon]